LSIYCWIKNWPESRNNLPYACRGYPKAVLAQIVERDHGMKTMRLQTELRSTLEAKLEMAEEALFHSNRNIELTMQIIILGPEQADHLLVKQA
jgi:hypothetical protein